MPELETAESRFHAIDVDRRSLLQATGGAAGLGALGVPLSAAAASPADDDAPVSMAMHIHGSFSEGTASMEAHLDQAQRRGVDVVWWTDHDFRVTAHGYRDAVGFDGPDEPQAQCNWSWQERSVAQLSSARHSFVAEAVNSDELGGCLEVSATASYNDTWAEYQFEGSSQNSAYSTSYGDTTIELDVQPRQVSADAQLVVEIASSWRPARSGRPAGLYRIQYRVVSGAGGVSHRTENNGLLGVVELPAQTATDWQRLILRPRDDHALLWPDTIAEDASLWRIRVGVRVRKSATGTGRFDRLRFIRGRQNGGTDALTQVRDIARRYRDRYPGVVSHVASEVSLVLHLNAFGGDHTLPGYDSPYAVKDASVAAQRAMVDLLHQQGATVCLNHPLSGSGGPDSLAKRLVTTGGMGADIIEIGVGHGLSSLSRVYDVAARNAVFLTANGTTDDHSGRGWWEQSRRWVTSVWSPSTHRFALCQALQSGRAWFHDPKHWRAALDLVVEGTARMGSVTFTDKALVDLDVRATALPSGSHLEIVVGRCDLAGAGALHPVNRSITVAARDVVRGHHRRGIRPGAGAYVRAMVRLSNGDIVGFSNPVWVLPMRRRGEIEVPVLRR
ncbi:MAG: hypothetical protein ACR2LE_08390 [Nocardioidaceae bacterium]